MVGLNGESCHRELKEWNNVRLKDRQLVGLQRNRGGKGPLLVDIARGSVCCFGHIRKDSEPRDRK